MICWLRKRRLGPSSLMFLNFMLVPASFPSHSYHCSFGKKTKVAMVAEMCLFIYVLINMNFHSPSQTWAQLKLNTRYANSRTQHLTPDMAPFPRLAGLQSVVRCSMVDHFLCGEEISCSFWSRYLFWTHCFCQNHNLYTYKNHIHNPGITYSISFTKEFILQPIFPTILKELA